jgi:hypothetical protein
VVTNISEEPAASIFKEKYGLNTTGKERASILVFNCPSIVVIKIQKCFVLL